MDCRTDFCMDKYQQKELENYERLNNTSTAMVHLSVVRIMINRF